MSEERSVHFPLRGHENALITADLHRRCLAALVIQGELGHPVPTAYHLLKAIADHPWVVTTASRLLRIAENYWLANVESAISSDGGGIDNTFEDALIGAANETDGGVIGVEEVFIACASHMASPYGGDLSAATIRSILNTGRIRQQLSAESRPPDDDLNITGTQRVEGSELRVIVDDVKHDEALELLNLIEQQIEDELENEDNPPEVRDFLRDVLLPEIQQLREVLEDRAETLEARPGLVGRAKSRVERLYAYGLAGTALTTTASTAFVSTYEAAERIRLMIP